MATKRSIVSVEKVKESMEGRNCERARGHYLIFYLPETEKMMKRAFDIMLPDIIGGKRYYHMTTETSKAAALKRVKAVRELGHKTVMRLGDKHLASPGHSNKWIIFVSKEKR